MRKIFLFSLMLSSICFVGCSNITENTITNQRRTIVDNETIEEEIIYKRDINLSKEDEEVLNNLEYFINSGIIDYKSGKIYKGLMQKY